MPDAPVNPPEAARATTDAPAPTPPAPGGGWMRLAWACVIVGLALRLVIATTTIGTNDIYTWERFGRLINAYGLSAAYLGDLELNHPPIPALWSALSNRLGGDNTQIFAFLIRLPAIAADLLTCWMLWQIGRRHSPRRAAALVAAAAFNPALILIGAYHGNTDNLYAAVSLLAFYLIGRDRPWLAGLTLGAAMNVKIIPMLLLPALVAAVRRPSDALRVCVGFALPLLLFLVPLHATDGVFFTRLFKYQSNPENWGVLYLLRLAEEASLVGGVSQVYFDRVGKWIMAAALLAAAGWAWRTRARPEVAGALGATLFLVLAPGFGVQYLAFPAVFILAVSLRWGVYYGLASGLFVGSCYYLFLNEGSLIRSMFAVHIFPPSAYLGVLAWAVLVGAAATMLAAPPRR